MPSVWIEKHGNRVAHTIIGNREVYYDVCDVVDNEEVTVWSKVVPFGRTAILRAGGIAFRNAAAEQEARLRQQMNS